MPQGASIEIIFPGYTIIFMDVYNCKYQNILTNINDLVKTQE